MRIHVIRYAIGLLILLVLLVHTSKAYEIPFTNSPDNLLYDVKIRITMPQTVDDHLIILDIDEKSLAAIGRWPWGRDQMAALVDKLFAESLQGRPVILGYYFSSEGRNNRATPGTVMAGAAPARRDIDILTWTNFGGNLEEFQKAGFGAGYVNPITDTDGSARRVPLIAKQEGGDYASLSLAMIRGLPPCPSSWSRLGWHS